MKPIRLSWHAFQQWYERGTNEIEVREAIHHGIPEVAKKGRQMYRYEIE